MFAVWFGWLVVVGEPPDEPAKIGTNFKVSVSRDLPPAKTKGCINYFGVKPVVKKFEVSSASST